ncbi:UV excision repair protein rad23 [Exophiala xenobiotica]|nr:UV excision repair protein rad23 [Exophiala xenobiotica]KAK5212314.1 UV excision repair protein rad23 [Exophiala xenobiotica]KAK5348236.1 UV excision repair protein rad23 [Exophiala xenobiotica]KAK5366041.1 UV excision repair protein rad23 [Exophiala xenobiotica]KAK5401209.1 UV excision repair protein rad23 [Exophiala xenobiotica]
MKLSFRDLKQQKFTIDAEPTDTIGQVKEKVAAEKGWEASAQKLIYAGKVLADANTVESYKIEEKGFIVCMVSKPKAAPASKPAVPSTPAASTSASTPAAPAAPQSQPAAAPAQPSTPTPGQAAAAAPASGPGFNDPSAFLMGNRNEATIREMEAMGFERAQIDEALRAAFFNPDRAIEYLLNGIPENIRAEQRQPTPAAGAQGTPASPPAAQPAQPAQTGGDEPVNLFEAAAQANQGRGGAARSGGGAAAAGGQGNPQMDLAYLRQSPHFQQLRQIVQQQPSMLEPILQQVAEGNPQLAQMISLNPDQFLQLLAEGQEGDDGALPPGGQAISVTPEERDAIERLCRLGFTRDQVIQAYFACDKNEELAANFLFEQPEDDEQQ